MEAWQTIQHEQFVAWVNSVISKRGMSISDLGTGFCDGLALVALVEVLTGREVRHCRKPTTLMSKLDNISTAIAAVEKFLGTSVVGLNAQDIAAGNSKQAMAAVAAASSAPRAAPSTVPPALPPYPKAPGPVPLTASRKSVTSSSSLSVSKIATLPAPLSPRIILPSPQKPKEPAKQAAAVAPPKKDQKPKAPHEKKSPEPSKRKKSESKSKRKQEGTTAVDAKKPAAEPKREERDVNALASSYTVIRLTREIAAPVGPTVHVDESAFVRTSDRKAPPEPGPAEDPRPPTMAKTPTTSPTSSPEKPKEVTVVVKDPGAALRVEEEKKHHHHCHHHHHHHLKESDTLAPEAAEDISPLRISSRLRRATFSSVESAPMAGTEKHHHHHHHHHHGHHHHHRHSTACSSVALGDITETPASPPPVAGGIVGAAIVSAMSGQVPAVAITASPAAATLATAKPPATVPPVAGTKSGKGSGANPGSESGSSDDESPETKKKLLTIDVASLMRQHRAAEARTQPTLPSVAPLDLSSSAALAKKKRPSGVPVIEAAFSGQLARAGGGSEPWSDTMSRFSRDEVRNAVFHCQAFVRQLAGASELRRSLEAVKPLGVDSVKLRKLLRFKALFCAKLAVWREEHLRLKNEKRRNEVAQEIRRSERSYVESLRLIDRLFYAPAQGFIPEQKLRHIFANLQIIQKYNELLLDKLEKRMEHWDADAKLGDIFIELSAFLRVYTPYVNNYSHSFAVIQEVVAENKKFADYLEKCKASPECGGLDLNSYLIMPIQRLPRYVLLLQDMLKFTRKDHPDHALLEKAYLEVKSVADYVNEKKREAENLNQVLSIQKKIVGREFVGVNLAMPHRRFVRQGLLLEVDDKSFMTHVCFLFNDTFLLSQPKVDQGLTLRWKKGSSRPLSVGALEEVLGSSGRYRFEALLQLQGAGVFEIPDDTSRGITNAFQLRLLHSRPYTFSCMSPEEKQSWIQDVDESISALLEKDWKRFKIIVEQRRKEEEAAGLASSLRKSVDVSTPDYEGSVDVLGSRDWKSRWLVLKRDTLYVFRDAKGAVVASPTPLKILPVLTARVSRVTEKLHAFVLVTQDRLYTIAAQDGPSMYRWLFCIRQAGLNRLASEDGMKHSMSKRETSPVASPTLTPARKDQPGQEEPSETATLLELLKSQPHNKVCADCQRPHVEWVSLTHGVFLCKECSSFHRLLPVGTSEVISLRALLRLPPSTLDALRKRGNARANVILEADMPKELKKPQPDDSRSVKQAWVQAKYSERVTKPISVTDGASDTPRESIVIDPSSVIKSGTVLKKEGTVSQAWLSYDLTLTKSGLLYRKKGSDTQQSKRWKPIDLTLCTPKDPDRPIPDAPCAFELIMPMRIFILSVNSQEEKQSWMSLISATKKLVLNTSM